MSRDESGTTRSGPVKDSHGLQPQSKRRILHFIDSGGIYGAEKVILSIARQMRRHDDYVPVIGCIVQDARDTVDLAEKARSLDFEAVEIVINNKRLPVDIFLAARNIQRLGIDLIHSHGYKPSVFGFAISRLINVPIMATCHLWFSDPDPPVKYRVMTFLERVAYRFYKRIVCVSPQIRQVLLDAGIDAEKITVIDNGIDIDDATINGTKETGAHIRSELTLKDDDFVVLNVGRLTTQKGQHNIIRLASMFSDAQTPMVFLIAGEGEARASLDKEILVKGLASSVRLLGFREDIGALLRVANAFFLPSLDEGLPISVLEAMACGVPVICTRVGAVPDLIEDEVDGLLVDVNNVDQMFAALTRIRSDPSVAAALSGNASRKIKDEYSSETMWRKYKTIYDELSAPAKQQDRGRP